MTVILYTVYILLYNSIYNSYMTADVCCHITVITLLMSDFVCYVT